MSDNQSIDNIIEQLDNAEKNDNTSRPVPPPDQNTPETITEEVKQNISEREKAIIVATLETIRAREEEQRMQSRLQNPSFVAEDIILSSDLPEKTKNNVLETIKELLQNEPGTSVREVTKFANTLVARNIKEHKANQEVYENTQYLKLGAMRSKYGEITAKDLMESMLKNYEDHGIAREIALQHLESLDHKTFHNVVYKYYSGPFQNNPKKVEEKANHNLQILQEHVKGLKRTQ